MAGSSPASRRSQPLSSPDRSRVSSFLSENRNTELNHQNALAAAAAEHDRVREAAVRTFHEYVLEEEQKRLLERQESILQQQRKEEERIRTEELLRVEEERLRALKLKTVPKLPPEPEPKPEPQASPVQVNGFAAHKEPVQPVPEASKETASSANPSPLNPQQSTTLKNPFAQVNGTGNAQTSPSILLNPFKRTEPISQTSTQSPQGKAPSTVSPFAQSFASGAPQQNGVSTSAPVRPPVVADVDPYIKIHKNLKQLRASLTEQAKRFPALKRRMGDMRRELRKNIGQLVGEKGGNRKQVCDADSISHNLELNEYQYAAIQALLDESLSGNVPSELIDPSVFITNGREPVQGASRNEPQLPSLFLYLLNQFSKAIINQFINECGAQPKSADPIGVTAAMIFAKDAYSWRGKTLIDILMAKFRVVCPVLFGYRGSEKTDQGRVRLGWKKDKSSGVWIPEQQHIDRMKGLGAGYSSIALRNFSKASTENPWPPRHYWTCMAKIVNTPGNEISNTQCVVLRAIIEENEDRFVQFYGSAAIAALRKALVEFPGRASDQKLPGVAGLTVMASMLKRDIGLEL